MTVLIKMSLSNSFSARLGSSNLTRSLPLEEGGGAWELVVMEKVGEECGSSKTEGDKPR